MWPHIIALLSAVVLIAIAFKIVSVSKAKARKKKEQCIEMVKISTIFRLEKVYTHSYDDPYFCRQLAQAVANRVFDSPPCGQLEMQFAKYNSKTIQRRLSELQDDPRLIRMLSVSAQVENNLNKEQQADKNRAVQPLRHLEELGLLDATAKPLDAGKFERVARDFYEANGAMSKVKN